MRQETELIAAVGTTLEGLVFSAGYSGGQAFLTFNDGTGPLGSIPIPAWMTGQIAAARESRVHCTRTTTGGSPTDCYHLSTRYYDNEITHVLGADRAAYRRLVVSPDGTPRNESYEPGLVETHATWAAAYASLLERLRERVRRLSVLLEIEQRQLSTAEQMQAPEATGIGPEWISLDTAEPAVGQPIVARYGAKQWCETWTPIEPRGLITHWIPRRDRD